MANFKTFSFVRSSISSMYYAALIILKNFLGFFGKQINLFTARYSYQYTISIITSDELC